MAKCIVKLYLLYTNLKLETNRTEHDRYYKIAKQIVYKIIPWLNMTFIRFYVFGSMDVRRKEFTQNSPGNSRSWGFFIASYSTQIKVYRGKRSRTKYVSRPMEIDVKVSLIRQYIHMQDGPCNCVGS